MFPFKRRSPVTPDQRLSAALAKQLDRLAAAEGDERIPALAALVAGLRPRRSERATPARRIEVLTGLLRSQPERRRLLRATLMQLLAEKQGIHLFSDAGVLSSEGFSAAFSRRLSQRLLPDVVNPGSLKDVLGMIFRRRDDYQWMREAGTEAWLELVQALDVESYASPDTGKVAQQIVAAMEVLSYRITSIGLEPELVRNYPAIERHESPFLTQNAEMRAYVDDWRKAVTEKRAATVDSRQIDVLLDQCTEIITKIRKQAAKTGASVSLTYLLVRLEQSIARFRTLMGLLEAPPAERNALATGLFLQLVEAENRRHSLSDLFSQNIELLAQRITGTAGRVGEKYIANTRAEYFALFRAALGAGFIIAFMAGIKLYLSADSHAPIVTAFLYSMVYGLGFVLIYLLGFTVATKQPAMTASTIAASIRSTERHPDRLEGLADLIISTLRSQFIAILGNLLLAFSVAALLGHLILTYSGEHFLSPDRAGKALWELNPLSSPAIPHAAIAGVCLFLSGLIAGYFDNRAVYSRIPERLAQLSSLRRLLGRERATAFGQYIGLHLGGIAGNFFFGVMLGSMGTLGYILGLPLDIRHIAFAAANYAYALVSFDWSVTRSALVISGLGVLAIGLTNLVVSFGLALFVAMRAQRVYFDEGGRLLRLVLVRLLRKPQRLFWPPRDNDPAAQEEFALQASRTQQFSRSQILKGPPGA
jgi:site-specific recombinase